MAPIALGAKQQNLLKAYLEVAKSEKPDWTNIAAKAEFKTPKYARDSWTLVKKKLLKLEDGKPIEIPDRQIALLKAVIEDMKATPDWEVVASKAGFSTAKYARDSWTIVRGKLIDAGGDDTGIETSAGSIKTKATEKTKSGKRKQRKVTSSDEDAALADDLLSNKSKKAKVGKKANKASRKVKVEEEEEVANTEQDASAEEAANAMKLANTEALATFAAEQQQADVDALPKVDDLDFAAFEACLSWGI